MERAAVAAEVGDLVAAANAGGNYQTIRPTPLMEAPHVRRHRLQVAPLRLGVSVPNASDDLPEPDTPVNTTTASRGMSTSTFFRLCARAPAHGKLRRPRPPARRVRRPARLPSFMRPARQGVFLKFGWDDEDRRMEMQSRGVSNPRCSVAPGVMPEQSPAPLPALARQHAERKAAAAGELATDGYIEIDAPADR